MLQVLTAADKVDLIDVATAKAMLQIQDASEDARLALLVPAATKAIEAFCGTVFARQEYQETLPGYGTDRISLSRFPVDTITPPVTSADGGETITDYSLEDPFAALVLRTNGTWEWSGQLIGTIELERAPMGERPRYLFHYFAGYRVPGQTTPSPTDGAPVPADLQLWAIEVVKAALLNLRRDPLVVSRDGGGANITYAQMMPDIAAIAQRAGVDPFRYAARG